MNVQAAIRQPEPVKLTVDDFLLLRRSDAFSRYAKSELLEGELWGVPLGPKGEPESDASFPIKLTVDQYEMLNASAAFDDCNKTELIDGLVYAMNPQYRPHGFVKDELAYRLRRALEALGSPLHVATEQSVAMAPFSEPQPDIILTAAPKGAGAIPVASVAVPVEVAGSTARFELGEKARAYAVAGIPEYWVADVNARLIHQMWVPADGTYSERREMAFGERIAAATINRVAVKTAGLN